MARRKKRLWIVPTAVSAAVVLGAGWMVYQGLSRKAAENRVSVPQGEASESGAAETENTAAATDTAGTESREVDRRSVVTWNGTDYVYNDHLSNFLFLGIDNREKTETRTGRADAGQADALFLLSWDRVTDAMTLISIPRDTMTDIEVFSAEGESLGLSSDHISLSFAYGDGAYESCDLVRNAVSNLFYGVPIQRYCAINMDGIPALVEAVDSVAVTVPNDSLETADPPYREGEEIILTADTAETFVRYRDTSKRQSALDRLERQNAFLDAYGSRVQEIFAGDSGIIVDIYDSLTPYMVTNMESGTFLSIMEGTLREDAGIAQWTLPGEGVEGESFDEYHVDEEALYERILETFYETAEE